MKKQAVNLLVFVLLGLSVGQTPEEVQQEKLEYRHPPTSQLESFLQTAQAPSFEQEMRRVKLEVHTFRMAQRRTDKIVTETVVTEAVTKVVASNEATSISEAAEMRQIKQAYRAFSSAHNRQRGVTADTSP